MMRVLSNVYPPEIKPVRDGWYLTLLPHGFTWIMDEWRVGKWHSANGLHLSQRRFWRGLAFNPAGAFEYDVSPGMSRIYGVFVPSAECC